MFECFSPQCFSDLIRGDGSAISQGSLLSGAMGSRYLITSERDAGAHIVIVLRRHLSGVECVIIM